jgi:hypothetical protein
MTDWLATYNFRDGDGDTKTVSIPFRSNDLIAIAEPADDPVQFAQQLAVYLDAITTGAIVSISLTANITLPAVQTVPAALSDVQELGVFKFRTENGFIKTVSVPTFDESLTIPGSNDIDLTELEIGDFVEAMIQPVALPGNWSVFPIDTRGEDIVSLESAYEDFT